MKDSCRIQNRIRRRIMRLKDDVTSWIYQQRAHQSILLLEYSWRNKALITIVHQFATLFHFLQRKYCRIQISRIRTYRSQIISVSFKSATENIKYCKSDIRYQLFLVSLLLRFYEGDLICTWLSGIQAAMSCVCFLYECLLFLKAAE